MHPYAIESPDTPGANRAGLRRTWKLHTGHMESNQNRDMFYRSFFFVIVTSLDPSLQYPLVDLTGRVW